MTTLRILTCFAFCLLATSTHAAELGRFILDGKEIIVFDDKTWNFADNSASAAEGCTVVESEKLPISVCLDSQKWTFANLGGAEEISVKLKEQELYLLMITEKQVIDLAGLKNAILVNAQNAAGLEKVTTLKDQSAVVDLKPVGQIIYSTTVDKIPVTYENFYGNIKGEGSYQFVFFAGRDEFDGFQPDIAEAVAGIKLSR